MAMDERGFWLEIRRAFLTVAHAIGQRYGIEDGHPDLYRPSRSAREIDRLPMTVGPSQPNKNGP